MPDPKPFGVQPLDAIAFLKNKLNVPTERWNDIWQDMHGAAFMVAGAQKAALIEDFHTAVTSAIEDGRTLEQFRQDFDQIVAKHGWDYNGSRNGRSEIIYRTNMSAAYSAGNWASIQRTKKYFPYIRYSTADDIKVRPGHKVWHNLVLPVDHPFWETHYPPNGWRCRCRADSINDRGLKKLGLKVSDDPEIIMEERQMKVGGDRTVTVMVPQGIHTGFAYNPGIAGFGYGTQHRALALFGDADLFDNVSSPGAQARQLPKLDRMLIDQSFELGEVADDAAHARRLLAEAIGGPERVFEDPSGHRVRITRALADHIMIQPNGQPTTSRSKRIRTRYFPLISDLIENPQEIWLGWHRHQASGMMTLRRKFVKHYDMGNGQLLILVGYEVQGEWVGLTFFNSAASYLKSIRTGIQVY
ncbi:MAG: hypothetical protein GQ535_12300 [Rhodobacteraceae bacterium]|nr:hypothetical protein [Paracoccaceae bacterium]